MLPGLSIAATLTVFGPETYERDNGKPVVVTNNFTATDGQICLLKIYNGGLKNDHMSHELVSSSVIDLNGVNAASPNEFNQHVTYIEKPVTLRADNTLEVEVRSKPGASMVIVIECEAVQNNPPTSSIRIVFVLG